MAAHLSFNPSKFRDKTPIPNKPISNFSLSSKPTNISYPLLPKAKPSSNITPYALSESSVSPIPLETDQGEGEGEEEEYDDELDDPTAELCYLDPESDPNSITEWELDFCSRPILDIRGKKLWELVVCDKSLSLQYTKYFPNNVINSITLKNAISSITDELGIPLPYKIRYFRSQMQTIITRACNELGIKPIPSKRCLSLLLYLEERYATIYQRHPGFQKGAKPLMALDNPFPMNLPENLVGEKWAFVQLPYSAVREEVASLKENFVFGAGLDLDLLGLEITENTLIPGLAVSSSRAKPLAAWMNGFEVCSIEVDTARAALVLSVGISTCYIYATYKKTSDMTKEAEAWEETKKASGGLHFLAIQEDLDSDDCVGFWLLLDLPPPSV